MRGVSGKLASPVRSVYMESFDDFPGPGADDHDDGDRAGVVEGDPRCCAGERDGVCATESYQRLAPLLEAQVASTTT
jgi:hypothetical protein